MTAVVSCRSLRRRDNLDERHEERRIEKVRVDDLCRACRRRGESAGQEAGRVAGENRAVGGQLVKFAEQLGLGVDVLVDRLDYQIGVLNYCTQVGAHPHKTRHRLRLLVRDAAKFAQAFEAVTDHSPRTFETPLGTGVKPHVVSCAGELDGDAVSHETGADNRDAANVRRVQGITSPRSGTSRGRSSCAVCSSSSAS